MICYSVAVAVLGACAPAPLAGACLRPPHPCSPHGGDDFLGGPSLAAPQTLQPSVFHSLFCCLGCDFVFFLALRVPWSLGFVSLWYVSKVRRADGRGFFASLTGRFCGGRWGRVVALGSAFGLDFCPFFVYE